MARSIGWITQLAKVAADPPHMKGSAVLAIPIFSLLCVYFENCSGGVCCSEKKDYAINSLPLCIKIIDGNGDGDDG